MQAVDATVEAWRREQLAHLLPVTTAPIAQLAEAAHLATTRARSISPSPFHWQYSVDRILRGLQFALNGLQAPRPHVASQAPFPRREAIPIALDIIQAAERYADAREVFLTYLASGFDLDEESSNDQTLRFVHPHDWSGARDYGDQVMARRIEEERAHLLHTNTATLPLPAFIDEALRSLHLQSDMPLGGITVAEFLQVWRALCIRASRWMESEKLPRFPAHKLGSVVERDTNLPRESVRRALELLRFDSTDSSLTCFHTPILLDENGYDIVLAAGFIFANPRVIVPRLCVRRGPGLNSLATSVARQLGERLKTHYESQRTLVVLEYPYDGQFGSGDIDVVAYDRAMHQLFLAEVKAFIPPATVTEVISANEALAEGLVQIDRARQWLEAGGAAALLSHMSAAHDSVASVSYAVLGNGFAGSDFLSIPTDVSVANADYLLRPIFRDVWLGDVLARWNAEIASQQASQPGAMGERTIVLGDITIRAPAHRLE